MLELLEISVSKRATLVTDLGQIVPAVRASAAQIPQIVMNLVTNASEAIGDRDGVIRVTTGRIPQAGLARSLKVWPRASYLELAVSDTGRGMSPETQAKIFEPFFSFKGAGHGLGLQLLMESYGVCGAIHVSSELRQGTTFQVLLPCAETTAEAKSHPMSMGEETAPPSQECVDFGCGRRRFTPASCCENVAQDWFRGARSCRCVVAIELVRASGSTST